jgi:hypothetical protein
MGLDKLILTIYKPPVRALFDVENYIFPLVGSISISSILAVLSSRGSLIRLGHVRGR